MASTYLTRNTGQAGTSGKKFTISFWAKIADVSNNTTIFGASSNATGSPFMLIQRTSGGRLRFSDYTNDTTTRADKTTTRLLRDPSAFYHIVIAVDTDQSTASERNRIYINGVEETSFNTDTNYSSGATTSLGQNNEMVLGRYEPYNANYFDGILAHFHYADGQQYAPTVFGESDSVSGIWKPKTAPSVTYGTNGFFLKFENSGNMGLDSSGNSNNFTVSGGTITQNVDTPSNNFATFNPLFDPSSASISFSNGNLRVDQDTSGWGTGISSLGVNTGKFYAEFKATSVASNGMTAGIVEEAYPNNLGFVGDTGSIGYHYNGTVYNRGSSSAFGNSYAQGDIIGVAMDLTNGYVYFSKNGTFQNSGDPTSGSSGTGGISIGGTSGSIYFLGQSINASGYHGEANFGQGYFGTTAVASAGTSPSGGGIFEFDCPSGFQSLSTKGINSF